MRPIRLQPNRPRSFYRAAGAIGDWRGIPDTPELAYHPEDWIASTTSRFGLAPRGQSVLPDGRLLADAVAADPQAWLGPEHVARHGADPALLVKLLDPGQRLPVHLHPDRPFAREHLASPYGKTEAWVVLAADPGARVHLGFTRDVAADELARWVARQDSAAMLGATNEVPVAAGDAILVPAGLPHAIGTGLLVLELQEPTDFSVLLEWTGFDVDGPAVGHLGLGYDLALQCVDRAAVSADRLRALRGGRPDALFPAEADPFFRADRLVPDTVTDLDPGFAVLAVLAGVGELRTAAGGALPLSRGETVLVPYAAGPGELTGDGLVVLRARPPRD